jgi:DNA-binding IclR family transcriptional regulator
MKRPKSDYSIQTVANTFHLLETFQDVEELGVTELSRQLALHKNNVFRILATLEELGYVDQCVGTERYRLSVRCLELARAFLRPRNLVRLGRPAVQELASASGESAHLAILDGFGVVHLCGEQSDRLVVTPSRVGMRLDAHCTALGKVLLACGDPALRARFAEQLDGRGAPLARRTPATVTDREKLLDHLRTVAAQGWAVDLEECEPGLCCAAAPVLDASGAVVAALSVSGPAFRLGADTLLQDVVPLVVDAAARLSRELGHAA